MEARLIALPILAVLCGLAAVTWRRSLMRALRRNIYLRLSLVFALLFLVGATGMWLAERGAPECKDFCTLTESVWSATVHVLSGLEDKEPQTGPGRLLSVIVLVSSIGLFGTVAGRFASMFMRRVEIKMPKDVTGHIIICNWNDRGDRVVQELHSPLAEPHTEIVVITDTEVDEEALRTHRAYERVYFVKGDPALHDVLRASRAHLAKSVVILADERCPDSDARSTLIALALSKLCISDSKPQIVAEARDHRKMQHLRDAGVNEVICSSDYGLGLLAQCALHAKMSQVYENLLTYSEDTNEIYVVEGDRLPSALIGKTFEEASEILSKNRDESNPAILLGVRRGDTVILNPRRDGRRPEDKEFGSIREGDALIVMAFQAPDLSVIT